MYHTWLGSGTPFASNPPPGYLTGGPNQFYSGKVSPPLGEPPMKAYRDWNAGFPENSWEITENQVSQQASYQFLLTPFVTCDDNPSVPQIPMQPVPVNPDESRLNDGTSMFQLNLYVIVMLLLLNLFVLL